MWYIVRRISFKAYNIVVRRTWYRIQRQRLDLRRYCCSVCRCPRSWLRLDVRPALLAKAWVIMCRMCQRCWQRLDLRRYVLDVLPNMFCRCRKTHMGAHPHFHYTFAHVFIRIVRQVARQRLCHLSPKCNLTLEVRFVERPSRTQVF